MTRSRAGGLCPSLVAMIGRCSSTSSVTVLHTSSIHLSSVSTLPLGRSSCSTLSITLAGGHETIAQYIHIKKTTVKGTGSNNGFSLSIALIKCEHMYERTGGRTNERINESINKWALRGGSRRRDP